MMDAIHEAAVRMCQQGHVPLGETLPPSVAHALAVNSADEAEWVALRRREGVFMRQAITLARRLESLEAVEGE